MNSPINQLTSVKSFHVQAWNDVVGNTTVCSLHRPQHNERFTSLLPYDIVYTLTYGQTGCYCCCECCCCCCRMLLLLLLGLCRVLVKPVPAVSVPFLFYKSSHTSQHWFIKLGFDEDLFKYLHQTLSPHFLDILYIGFKGWGEGLMETLG